jgi:hypothetical protein
MIFIIFGEPNLTAIRVKNINTKEKKGFPIMSYEPNIELLSPPLIHSSVLVSVKPSAW